MSLDVKKLSFKINKDHSINDVSLSVDPGEIACLVGESGSGKSTILKLICGLEDTKDGSIIVANKIVSDGNNFVPPQKRGIGVVFQDPSLFPYMTCLENVVFAAKGFKKKQAEFLAQEELRKVGMESFANRYPHSLSGGQIQRVAIARALIAKPKILLLDEPFANLDSYLRRRIRDEMFSLFRQEKITVLMVTHDPGEAFSSSDKIFVLKDGAVVQAGAPQDIYHKPVNIYVARFFGEINLFSADIIDDEVILPFSSFKVDNLLNKEIYQIGVRPTSIKISDDAKNKNISGDVLENQFFGFYNLLKVKIDNYVVKLVDYSKVSYVVGDRVSIEFAPQEFIFFEK